jgi:hypothetical protein
MALIVKPVGLEIAMASGNAQSFGSNTGGSTSMGGIPGHDVYVRVFNANTTAAVLMTRYAANTAAYGNFSNVALGSVTLGPNSEAFFALSKNEFLGSNNTVNCAPCAILGA